MQNKKNILPIAIVFLMALAVTFVGAQVELATLEEPTFGSNWTTTLNITVSTASKIGEISNITNVTCFYNSSGGAANATTFLVEILNSSDDTVNFTSSVTVSAFTETTTYNISCTLRNYTTWNGTVTMGAGDSNVAGFGIDYTAPTVTMSTDYSSVNLGRYFQYTISISDATTGIRTSYCNITDAEGEVDKDGVISTSASSVDFKNTHTAGDYNITCVTVDDAGNARNNSVVVAAKTTGAPIKSKPTISISDGLFGLTKQQLIIVAVVIGGLAIVLTKKK